MLLTPQRVGHERAAAAVGWQMAASSLGAAGGPAVAGVILDAVGVDAYGPIALALSVALAVAVTALRSAPAREPVT
jgi:MFS family permease